MERTISAIFCVEGAFARRAVNQEIDALFEDAVRNTVAFALHGADLKQYIFALLGSGPMPAGK
ncbi:hypothetical protein [Rhizobium bangladeshense]|uniref:hypothetical protein n=1 Tax=Rhizobium bangladeshense TaxID=1138189 RepID=UPI0007E531A3|nr:hypothetical protein [Rhizobium bangladeshense]